MQTRISGDNPCASPTLTLLARNPASPSTGQHNPAALASPLDEFRSALEGAAGATDRGDGGGSSRRAPARGARGGAKGEGAESRGTGSGSGSGSGAHRASSSSSPSPTRFEVALLSSSGSSCRASQVTNSRAHSMNSND